MVGRRFRAIRTRHTSLDLVLLPVAAVGIDPLGGLEVPDGAANIVEQALGLDIRVAGPLKGAVHATLSERHASGHRGRPLGREHCVLLVDVADHGGVVIGAVVEVVVVESGLPPVPVDEELGLLLGLGRELTLLTKGNLTLSGGLTLGGDLSWRLCIIRGGGFS